MYLYYHFHNKIMFFLKNRAYNPMCKQRQAVTIVIDMYVCETIAQIIDFANACIRPINFKIYVSY